MRLVIVSTPELAPFFGLELSRRILRVPAAAAVLELPDREQAMLADTAAYFAHWPASEKALRTLLKRITETPKALARPAPDGQPCFASQDDVTWHPPLARPAKILCIGLNYRDHCEEQGREIPKKPLVFPKFATSLVGHLGEVPLPLRYDKKIDYEVELAVVIGRRARRVTRRTALKHVAGYTIMNDVSARTIQANERQWARAKGFDHSGPCGPAIVTPDEIPDPHNLSIQSSINGDLRQQSHTGQLIFDVPHLISFISQMITLEPGDIISTGTPGGVGLYMEPPVFLQPGDVMEMRIERLGTLRNTCVKG